MALWTGETHRIPSRWRALPSHNMAPRLRTILACIALFSVFALAIKSEMACAGQDVKIVDNNQEIRRVTVTQNKSKTLELPQPFAAVVVGDPKIADALVMSGNIVYLQGKKPGTTNISVFDRDKQLVGVIDVDVSVDVQYIARNIRSSLESTSIRVSGSNKQIVLSGTAKDAPDAERAVAIAKAMAPEVDVINAMKVAPSQQVLLKVRYLEVDRNAAREVGVNWFGANKGGSRGVNTGVGQPATGSPEPSPFGIPLFEAASSFASGTTAQPFAVAIASIARQSGTSLDVMLSALEKRNLVRALAEPDLVALSGDSASFLAGGEVPVPVVQPSASGSLITVEYKRFGVELKFVPTVLGSGVINLRLAPSVSQLDYTNAVLVSGFRIPALTKRETTTTIELRDGQSFAISGLLQSEGLRDISQVPWLGTVPVLGALFRSSSYQQKETDLVVIVTVHLVQPAAPGQQIATPLDQRIPSNDVDFFLNGQLDLRKKYTDFVTTGGDIKGSYGHIMPLSTN
jgi:pilus assembly protein CpaC